MTDYLPEANNLFNYMREMRRDFHVHPELGFQEFRTAGIIASELKQLGLEVNAGVGGTGVVALIEGAKPGPVILVRADMDALPITEETGAEYASQNKGVMHACGHDGHSATLLAVARMLNAHRKDLAGTVKLVFQPAEEGGGGAEKMIADGVLENPRVDLTLALHVWNERPLGWIGISDGPSMAGGEMFQIKVIGKGGHGAVPHLAIDPILAASQVVTSLQAIVARNVSPLQTAVISVCSIHGGDAFNVIPQSVELKGTIRTFDPTTRTEVLQRFREIVNQVALGMGCKAEIILTQIAPAVINHGATSQLVQKVARQLFPGSLVDTSNYVTMGSEDMSYMMEKVPGCFFFIGSANPDKGLDAGHHHPRFDFDENCLPLGAALMASVVAELLKY